MVNCVDVSKIQGVIFDLDGTLVDSHLDFEVLRKQLRFPPGQPILEYLEALDDHHQVEIARNKIIDYEIAGAKKATWMPGAQSLIDRLHQRHIPMAILTRNTTVATRLMIDTLRIPIDLVLTREDCKPKPDPEGLLRIAAHWGLDSTMLMYVGDYVFDLEAAHGANMLACLYSNPHNEIFAEKADWVFSHFDELSGFLGLDK